MAILMVPPYSARQAISLTVPEIWQIQGGSVRLQIGAPVNDTDGLLLGPEDSAIRFDAGVSVTVWLDGPIGSQVVRMALE